jgi:hypothetical protein
MTRSLRLKKPLQSEAGDDNGEFEWFERVNCEDSHNRGATKAPCTLLVVASFSRFFKVQLITSLHSPHFPCFTSGGQCFVGVAIYVRTNDRVF